MEVTYGLIANLVKTKSLERVLAPIASQISLLIILNESNGTSSSSKDEGRENQISQCALGLIKAVHRFIQVGQKQIQDSKDPVLQTQMKSACESLDLAGSDLKIASQKYQADVTNKQNGDRLIQAAKDVLHSMLKVLLVSDDSTVRKTLGLVESVQEKLSKVNSVQDKQQFLSAFKEFSEILIVLITMLKSRQSDLIRGPDREWLIREMNHLQKSIPSLSVSIQTYLKYINNPKAQVGKSSVVQEISSSLSKIHLFLENKPISDKSNDVVEDGHFVSRMSEVLEILKVEKRSEPLHDLEANLAVIVGHSMTVAHFCLDFHRNLIIRSSQRILQAKGRVLELQTLTKTNPNITEIRRDFDGVCEMLMDELCDLEKHVNVSLLYLIIDVFKETNQPIDRLLKTALQADQVSSDVLSSNLDYFTNHADKLCQISSLAAASSTNSKRVREIRSSVYRLEKLDPDIVAVVATVVKDTSNVASVEHLKLLVKSWRLELSSLVSTLDQMSDPRVFLDISEKKILDGVEKCKMSIRIQDVMMFKRNLRDSLNYSRRVIDITNRIIDNHTDAIFRNGFLVFVKKLQTARYDVSEAGNNLMAEFTKPLLQDTAVRRLNILEDCVTNVKKGLSSENHLPLSHPDRQGVRKPKTKKKGNKMAPMPPGMSCLKQQKQMAPMPPGMSRVNPQNNLNTKPSSRSDPQQNGGFITSTGKENTAPSNKMPKPTTSVPQIKISSPSSMVPIERNYYSAANQLVPGNQNISSICRQIDPMSEVPKEIQKNVSTISSHIDQKAHASRELPIISNPSQSAFNNLPKHDTMATTSSQSERTSQIQDRVSAADLKPRNNPRFPVTDKSVNFRLPEQTQNHRESDKQTIDAHFTESLPHESEDNPNKVASLRNSAKNHVKERSTEINGGQRSGDAVITDSDKQEDISPKSVLQTFITAAVNRDRSKMDTVTADILRLTNHIVECSRNLVKHCPQLERKQEIKILYKEIEEVSPRMVEKARFVSAGDGQALDELHILTDDWSTKYKRLRILIDVAVDRWSKYTYKIHQTLQDKNRQALKLQLQQIEKEKASMSDLLTVASTLPFQSSSNEDVLDFLTEQGKDMENLTATINTTCDVILQSGFCDETNKDEILELCREWNVCMTCITSELETLTQGIISIGSNALPALREITQATTAKIKLKLTKEAEVLKELLLMVTQGDAAATEKSNDLVFDMSHIPEELELDDSPAKIRNADIYKQLTTDIIISKWILKGLQSVRVITSATSDYTVLIDDLLDSTHDITTQADMKKKINDFQSKMAAIRQKVLQGIVLSPDLNQRAVVRKCLDDITDILPSLVDAIYQSIDDEDEKFMAIIWPLKHKIGARLRRIVFMLETMTEVKHKVLKEVKKLLDPSSDNSRYQSRTSLSLTPSLISSSYLKSPYSSASASKKTIPLKVSPSTLSNPKCPRVAGSALRKKSYGDNDTSYSMQALQPIFDDQDSKSPGQSPYLFKNLRLEQTSTPKGDINDSFNQRRITLDLKSNVNYIERQIERWNENNNPVVMVTVELTQYVTNMVRYCVGEGLIANIEEMIEVAGRVVDCGVKLRDFAVTVANLATDSSHADDLILSTNQITTSAHQLKMIAKVFVSATKNHQTEKILTRNARDLMQGVRDMFELAEIMCIKGLSLTGEKTREEMDALALLKSWQRRLLEQRHEELNSTELDELGLRRVEEHNPPRLSHLLDNGYYI